MDESVEPQSTDDLRLEIGHVLFLDLVGYSKLLIEEQKTRLRLLTEVVLATTQVRGSNAETLVRLPTGDGMALVFRNDSEIPVSCALEIASALQAHPQVAVRMGIHSGPISSLVDVDGRANVAGAGINLAQRVMDCGDAGHILLSKRVADDLLEYRQWSSRLHDLGDVEVKHGVRLHLFNLHADGLGNAALPEKFRRLQIIYRKMQSRRRTILVLAAGGLVCVVAGTFFWTRQRPATKPAPVVALPAVMDSSIAVLPFANLSEDKSNAFFALGIQDEILTALAKISGLKVVSRTSTASYESSPEHLPEIARALGVAHILEGSVQKMGDRVHINVQLLRAASDEHLWAESYDRQLADIFSVEVEVAEKVANSLRAVLSPEEKARMHAKPTENQEAYLLYLQARVHQTNASGSRSDNTKAANLYAAAIQLDPLFALAHARLSASIASIYQQYEPSTENRDRARVAAAEALRLDPNLGEAHLAQALCYYWIDKDFGAALQELAITNRLLPHDSDVESASAYINRRMGHWLEARDTLQKISDREPGNGLLANELTVTNFRMRDWAAAVRAADHALSLTPDRPSARLTRAYLDFWWKGDLLPLQTVLHEIKSSPDPDGQILVAEWDTALLARDFAGARRVVENFPQGPTPGVLPPKSYFLGLVALANGERERAQKLLEEALPTFEEEVQRIPGDPFRRAYLGLIESYLGRKEAAIRDGQQAMALLPESQDAINGPQITAVNAIILTQVGKSDEAIALISHLLTIPGPVDMAESSMTLADLRLRWQWDPLRKDPRFQKILAGPEPKTISP